MSIKAIILSIVATFAPDGPTDKDDDPSISEDHYFCCEVVNDAGKGSGDGCVKISEDHVNSCSQVLGCSHGFTKDEGAVRCTGPK
jgi:hypothetical protein